MIDLAEPLAQGLADFAAHLAATVPPPGPTSAPGGSAPTTAPGAAPAAPTPMDTKPIAQVIFITLGLTIAGIVLVAGLFAIAALRRTRRTAAPTPTPHVDAWAESGKRAQPEPSARDLLDINPDNNPDNNSDNNLDSNLDSDPDRDNDR